MYEIDAGNYEETWNLSIKYLIDLITSPLDGKPPHHKRGSKPSKGQDGCPHTSAALKEWIK